jgi:hypothetical protein
MEEGKIATATVCGRKKSINVYKNACATLSNTLLAGQVRSILFGPASRFTSATERSGKWKKVR